MTKSLLPLLLVLKRDGVTRILIRARGIEPPAVCGLHKPMETTNICMVLEGEAMIDCPATRPGGEEVPGVESLARDVDAGNKEYLGESHLLFSLPQHWPTGQ